MCHHLKFQAILLLEYYNKITRAVFVTCAFFVLVNSFSSAWKNYLEIDHKRTKEITNQRKTNKFLLRLTIKSLFYVLLVIRVKVVLNFIYSMYICIVNLRLYTRSNYFT